MRTCGPAIRSPEQAVDHLVELVHARKAGGEPAIQVLTGAGKTRAALELVLGELRVRTPDRAAWADGADVLGAAYEILVPAAERRAAGQFQTPLWAADLMAAWLLREPVRLLLDPGVGAGRLLFRAAGRARPPKRMLGLDTDPLACAMASINLRMRGLAGRAKVRQANFLLDELPEEPDAISCNPPYSRHHAIAAEAKTAIHDRFERDLGVKFSGLSALHALFLVRAIEVASPGARIAFITAGDWLETNYGRAIKTWVLDHAHVEGLVLFSDGALPFGRKVKSSAGITLLRKHEDGDAPAARPRTRVVRLPCDLPPVEEALAAIASEQPASLPAKEVELTPAVKWSRPRRVTRRTNGTPLSELARIRRGIATGHNRFFVISEADRHEWGLPVDELRSCLATPRLVDGLEVGDLGALEDNVPRWLLSCWRPDAEREHSPLGAYLRHGRELGAADTYLGSNRTPWHGLERREPPAILWPYFNRHRLRFIRNRTAALVLNNSLGIEPVEGVDSDELWELLNHTRTLTAVRRAGRSYAGMTKLEPKELGVVRVEWRA